MLTICSRWESLQMSAELEWRMWRQLKGAFGIGRFCFTPILPEMRNRTFEQFATMQEALDSCRPVRVFLEPNGEYDLGILKELKSPTLVIGNTEFGNMDLVRPQDDDITVRIKTPGNTDLYGINAAAIALAHWYGQ